jgi:hypothetical protein
MLRRLFPIGFAMVVLKPLLSRENQVMQAYTEDHLAEQPAIQLMQHELGWDVVNCYGDPTSPKLRRTGWSGVSNQGRDGKPSSPPPLPRLWRSRRLRRPRREGGLTGRLKPALRRLNPDLPVGTIEGAVEENGILNFECWILNGRGRRQAVPLLNPNSGGGGRLNALVDEFQYFWRFH